MASESEVRKIAKEQGLNEAQTENAVRFASEDAKLDATDAVQKAKSS